MHRNHRTLLAILVLIFVLHGAAFPVPKRASPPKYSSQHWLPRVSLALFKDPHCTIYDRQINLTPRKDESRLEHYGGTWNHNFPASIHPKAFKIVGSPRLKHASVGDVAFGDGGKWVHWKANHTDRPLKGIAVDGCHIWKQGPADKVKVGFNLNESRKMS